MRTTSIEVYNTLWLNGILNGIQFKVFEVLYNNGPLTQGETWNEHLSEYQRHSIAPRFAELEKMGMIKTVGERSCRFSNVRGLEWDVTDHVPEAKLERIPKKRLQDVSPKIIALLTKVDVFLKTLPEGGMSEVLQYDINNLKEKLQ